MMQKKSFAAFEQGRFKIFCFNFAFALIYFKRHQVVVGIKESWLIERNEIILKLKS